MASQDRRIHSFKECVPEGSDYISADSQEEESQEEKVEATEDQALSIQRRSLNQ